MPEKLWVILEHKTFKATDTDTTIVSAVAIHDNLEKAQSDVEDRLREVEVVWHTRHDAAKEVAYHWYTPTVVYEVVSVYAYFEINYTR